MRRAVESVLQQTFSDFEFLIALDDPDNQPLLDILEEYKAQDSRIRLFVNERNLGLTQSLNKLLQQAQGDVIARMDADDISMPERFFLQYAYMESRGLDLLSCDVSVIDENGETVQEMRNLPSEDGKIKRKLKVNNCLPHPGWMVKTKMYQELGGYHPVPYCEDYEFLLRGREAGYVFGNLNEVLLKYRMTSTSISRSGLYRQFLAMKFCQEKYIAKKQISWDDYMADQFDAGEEQRYCLAANAFTEGLQCIRKHQFFRGLKGICAAFAGSRCYREKMWKYLQQVL